MNPLITIFISSIVLFLIILLVVILLKLNPPVASKLKILFQRYSARQRVERLISRRKEQEVSIVKLMAELGFFMLLIALALTHKVFWAVAVSNSMYPTFEKGDMILMQSLIIDPEPGDIVMFNRPDLNYAVTHRVLKVDGDRIYTGGDASGPDSWFITRKDILAEAIQISGKPIVLKAVGNYFILNAKELRSIGPFGQEYLFYKNLVNLFRSYAVAIIIISITAYIYLEIRGKKVKI